MAVQANPYFAMTDGVTTVTFADGSGGVTNFGPQAATWAPNVAPLRRSPLGGRSPYEDVVEELTINVRDSGATAALAMANLKTLNLLLDQAERWTRGEYVNAVVIRYTPQGSTTATTSVPYQAIVLGRANDDTDAMLALPPRWDLLGMTKELWSVRLRFVRMGQWLLGDFASGTAASISSGNVATCSFAAGVGGAQRHSPVANLTLGTFTTTNIPTLYPGFVMVAGNTASEDGIQVVNASAAGGLSAPFSTVNESANNARSGASTLRYTPASTAFVAQRCGALSWSSARRLAVFAVVRNNDAAKSYQLRCGYAKFTGTFSLATASVVKTAACLISGSSTSPQAIYVGTMSIPNSQYGEFFFEIAASATGSTFDIDAFVVVCLDDDTTTVIGHGGMDLNGAFGAGVTVLFDWQSQLNLASPSDARPEPFVGIRQNGASTGVALSYSGNARPVVGRTEFNILWLTTTGTKWRFSQAGGTVQTFTVTPNQFEGYMTPL